MVLHKNLAQAETAVNELTIPPHKHGLTLRGIVGFVVFVAAGKFPSGALDEVEPADFRRARRNPYDTGAKFA